MGRRGWIGRRWWLAAGAAAWLPAGLGAAAAALPPPLGQWTSKAGNVLIVHDNATCAYFTSTLRVQGSCSWHPASHDGILTIIYRAQNRLQRMDVSISWIKPNLILVLGEPFRPR